MNKLELHRRVHWRGTADPRFVRLVYEAYGYDFLMQYMAHLTALGGQDNIRFMRLMSQETWRLTEMG